MSLEEQRDHIIENLERLNAQVARQNSIGRVFFMGIFYGVGFFVGSAILATILIGVLAPVAAPWVKDSFEKGAAVLGR